MRKLMRKGSIPLILIILITMQYPINVQSEIILTKVHDLNYKADTSKTFTFENSFKPSLPDIGDYSDANLTDFPVNSSTVYGYDDIIPVITENWFHIKVSIVAVFVIDKHEFGTAGDIFIEGSVNGNETRYPDIGNEWQAPNDNFNITEDVNVFEAKSKLIDFTFEVRESDTGSDESLGFVSIYQENPTNETYNLTTDVGDAIVYVDIYAEALPDLTAGELLDGYRPYISIDDETDATEMPDFVVGRVISGTDNSIDALVLQYYFYWAVENSPDGGLYSFQLHENDFEALLVYFDITNMTMPYRIVFNNWQYSNLDEFPAESIRILEKDAIESQLSYLVDISKELQVLLGVTTELSADTKPISSLKDWEYNTLLNLKTDVRRTSLLGYKTIDISVDTSYHTFDLGPSGKEYGYNYSVQALNTSLIQDWYAEVNRTFELGTHSWSYFGIDIPFVAPFSHDVMQVFTKPYIISAYSNVVEDAGAVMIAKNSYLNTTQSLTLGISFNVPAQLEIKYPKTIATGTSSSVEFTLIPKLIDAYIEFTYGLASNISFAYWFAQANVDMNHIGSIKVNLFSSNITSILDTLGLGSFEEEDVPFNDYISLDYLTINSAILGTILEGQISMNLWEVVKTVLEVIFPQVKPVTKAIDYFLDSINLVVNPKIEGIVRHNVDTNNIDVTLSKDQIVYSTDKLKHVVDITASVDADLTSDLDLRIGDVNYALNFTTDWFIETIFKKPISIFIPELTWEIGTFPIYTADLISSAGTTVTILNEVSNTSSSSTITSTRTTTSESDTEAIPILMIDVMLMSSFITYLVLKRKTNNDNFDD